jgi:hypothetical protein
MATTDFSFGIRDFFVLLRQSYLLLVQGKFHTVFKGANIRTINQARAFSQVTHFSRHVRPVVCELRERLRQEDNFLASRGWQREQGVTNY